MIHLKHTRKVINVFGQRSITYLPCSDGALLNLAGWQVFVARVSSSGTVAWAINVGGSSSDDVEGIASDGANGAVVCGSFKSTATFGSFSRSSGGMSDLFVMRVDSTGTVQWVTSAGSSGNDACFGMDSDGGGGALVAGWFAYTVTFGANTLTSDGHADAFAMRVDSSGAIVWTVNGGGSSADCAFGIASDGAGGAIFSGWFQNTGVFGSSSLTNAGSKDVFVAHVSASGATASIDWALRAGGSSNDGSDGVYAAADGDGG